MALAIALPLAALATVLAGLGAAERRDEMQRGMAATVRAVQLAVDAELRVTVAALEALAAGNGLDAAVAEPPDGVARAAFHAHATALVARRPAAMQNVVLFAPDGQQLVNTLVPPRDGLPGLADVRGPTGEKRPDDRERWAAVLASPRPFASELVRGPVAGVPLVTIALPVRRDGKVVAVISANLLPSSLGDELRKLAPPDRWAAAIVDQAGRVITRTLAEENVIGGDAGPEVRAFLRSGQAEGAVRSLRPDTDEGIYAALRRSEVAPWLVAYSAPRAVVDAPVLHAVWMAATAGAFAAAIAAAGALLLGRGLAREVDSLGQAARRAIGAVPADRIEAAPPSRIAEVAATREAFAQATAALREAEERLRRVLDNLFAFVGVLAPDGTLLDANRAPLEAAGIALEDVRGRPFWECAWWTHDPAEAARVRAACARAAAGEASRYDAVVRMAGDSRMVIDFQIAPLRDESGRITHLIPSATDVTARTAAETALRERGEHLRLALAAADFGTWRWETGAGTDRLAWDARCKELFGLAPDAGEVDYATWSAMLVEEDRALMEAALARALDPADPDDDLDTGYRIRLADGRIRWLDVSGRASFVPDADAPAGRRVLRILGVIRDGTGAREAQAALARTHEEARAAAERVQLALAAGAIVGTWDWDLVADRFTLDERFAESFGIDPALGRAGLSLEQVIATVHPEDLAGLRAAIAEAMARGGPYSHEYRVRGRDGVYRWIQANGRVDLAPDGTPRRFPGVLLDIGVRRALEAERDRTAELLRTFVAAVPGVVYAKDRAGRMLVANAGVAALVGKPLSAILGRTDAEFLDDPAQAAAVMANDRRIMESGTGEQVEEAVNLPGGAPAWWLSSKAPFRNAAGAVVGLIGASVDITARKQAEERLQLMVNELNHRVKNTLATVQSIAAQSLRGIDAGVRRGLETRLLSLAAVHDVLTRESWAGADVADVVAGVVAPHGGEEGGSFRVSGPRLRLMPRPAVALSMALHELATNALKYGALSVPAGRVEIGWEVSPGAEPMFRLRWTEHGGPPVVPPTRRGFGVRLIECSLSQDLNGTASITFAPDGIVCVAEAKLSGIIATTDAVPLLRLDGMVRDGNGSDGQARAGRGG